MQSLLITLIAAIFWFVTAVALPSDDRMAQNRPDDFGRQWVRSHPFTLMALVLRDKAVDSGDPYIKAGLNTMLVWKKDPGIFRAAVKYSIPWHYHLNRQAANNVESEVDQLLKNYPGAQGILVWDEPKLPDMPRAGKMVAQIKQAHPELLVYSNVNPIQPPFMFSFPNLAGEKVIDEGVFDEPPVPYTYDDHLDNLAQIVKADVLMGDIYPFWATNTLSPDEYLRNQYFFMLTAFRKAGLKHNRPYWVFVQAYEHPERSRYPSEADLRMQVYSSLVFGFTGIAYFTYDTSPPHGRSILQHDFSPAPLYYHVKALNAEVMHLGKVLRFLTSTDVRYLPGTPNVPASDKNQIPRAMAEFHSKSRVAKEIREVRFGGTGYYNDGLIGFFRDDAGGKYFMVVNLQHGEGKSAEATRASISITMDPSIKALYRLSRYTGKPESVPLVDGKLKIDLPGGTADLFKMGDARFPGL